jgi:hypothetical protein
VYPCWSLPKQSNSDLAAPPEVRIGSEESAAYEREQVTGQPTAPVSDAGFGSLMR